MNVIFLIPGYANSDENHWQTLWEKKYSGRVERLMLEDFLSTSKEYWTSAILEMAKNIDKNYIVVAHSLGALSFAHAYSENELKNLKAVMLVAPPDVEQNQNAAFLPEFSPIPDFKFNVPAVLVASSNDPFYEIERADEIAQKWGAELINVGPKGHINSESDLGDWPEGLELLQKLTNY